MCGAATPGLFSCDLTSLEFSRQSSALKMAKSVTALTLVALLAFFELGSCLQCYQCVSEKDPSCKDSKVPKSLLVDCGRSDSTNFNVLFLNSILPRETTTPTIGAAKYCHKIVMMSGSVARTCLESNPQNLRMSCDMIISASKLTRNPEVQIKECAVCDKDECNAAGSIAASLPLAGLALLATYFYTQ